MNKRSVFLPIIIAVSIVAGVLVAMLMDNGSETIFKNNQTRQNKLNALLDFVAENYVDTINKAELIEQAIPDFLEELDPHSIYIPAEDLKEMNEPLEGNFEGIGIQFNMRHDTLLVLHVISGGPSEKAGLQPGDRMITVNDSVIAGVDISTRKVMSMLKGEKGTEVTVGIKRDNVDSLIHYTIIRDEIPLYSVDVSYMPTESTGFIKVSSFSNTTYSEFMDAVYTLKAKGMENLILDLRSNSGGIMSAADRMVDEFLEGGKLIVYTQGRKHGKVEEYATDQRHSLVDIDVAVLIDEFSASASEIVAGAIQDNDRGWIIGRRSFGKGLVQEPVQFEDGSALRLTVARYYTPSGRCIQKDYGEDLEDYYSDITERFMNGELMEADSVQFADSLKYTTRKGRTVYGGGGIMPDIFVPVDTTGSSELYKRINNKHLTYEFAMRFTENHREKLQAYNRVEELQQFLKASAVFEEFLAFVREKGIKTPESQINQSGELLQIQLHAMICRNILNDDGFYPVIHQVDTTFNTALDVLESDRSLLE